MTKNIKLLIGIGLLLIITISSVVYFINLQNKKSTPSPIGLIPVETLTTRSPFDNPYPNLRAAMVNIALGDMKKAEDLLSQAESASQKDGWFNLVRGELYYYRDRNLTAAEADFRKAIDLNKNIIRAYELLALVLIDKGDLDEAEKWAKEGLKVIARGTNQELTMNSSRLWFILSLVYNAQNRWAEALEAANTSISGNPFRCRAYYSKGIALANLKEINKAWGSINIGFNVGQTQELLSSTACKIEGYLTMARLSEMEGKIEEAINYYEKAANISNNVFSNWKYYQELARNRTQELRARSR